MGNKRDVLEAGFFYHIYNHAVADGNLFIEDANYQYFLKLWEKYSSPIAETYAYCLMPNHFHFLVRIKEADQKLEPNRYSQIFGNCFNAYSKAINKRYSRKGSLFYESFNRKRVKDDRYLKNLIVYIHQNPMNSKFADKIMDWKYSSYDTILRNKASFIYSKNVIKLFEDEANFVYCHKKQVSDMDY
jgi:putative transposase